MGGDWVKRGDRGKRGSTRYVLCVVRIRGGGDGEMVGGLVGAIGNGNVSACMGGVLWLRRARFGYYIARGVGYLGSCDMMDLLCVEGCEGMEGVAKFP